MSFPPPPAPQWFDWAWPIVSFTSQRATSRWSQTGVPREETPTYSYMSAFRGLVLEELDPEPLHPLEVLPADLLLDVGVGHREHLAVRADHDRLDAGRLDGVEHRRQQLRLRRRAELVVDHDREPLLAGEQLGEARARDGRLERRARGLGRVADRVRLVGIDRPEQVRLRDLELERLAGDFLVVAGRADRERVERLVRNHGAICVRHGSSFGRGWAEGYDARPTAVKSALRFRQRPSTLARTRRAPRASVRRP